MGASPASAASKTEAKASDEQEGAEEAPAAKKAKKDPANGQDFFVSLAPEDASGRRRVTVNEFGGALVVDIRDWYAQGDEMKPGKKGISLKVEEWRALQE